MEQAPFNIYAVIAATFVTMVVGFFWYSPKVFGNIWMRETGMTDEKARQSNMFKIFSLTILYSFMLSFIMPSLVIHQMGVLGTFGGDMKDVNYIEFMKLHGNLFRTYKHGALHGFISGLFIALPITAINGLFEHKSWKFILITSGYWIISMMIMGAIICGWR